MNSGPLFDERIVALAKRFVCVRIDTDETPVIYKRYGVRDLPTLVFLTRSGLVLGRYVNAQGNPADRVLAALQGVLLEEPRAHASEQKQVAAVRAEPTAARWKALADYYAKRQAAELAIAAYQQSYRLEGRAETITALVLYCMRDRYFERALAACEQGLEKYANTPDSAPLLYYKGLALVHGFDRRADARACWDQIVRRYPFSKWAKSARKTLEKYKAEADKR